MRLAALLIALTPVSTQECGPCEVSDSGVALIQHFEGYSPFAYEDVAGKKSIGFGHLMLKGERFEEPLLPDEADDLMRNDLDRTVDGVNDLLEVDLKQNQFDSLVSFSFNVGTGAFESSTLLRRVNAERHREVPAQFLRWNRAGGKVSRGLTIRRETEARYYAQ
jgi:lysozyme